MKNRPSTTFLLIAALGLSSFGAPAASVRITPTVLNVKDAPYNARGDGVTDDTAAIQAAVNAVGGTGGTVLVPDGVYLINALTRVQLKSKMTFKMTDGATLKAKPTSSGSYAILHANNVSNLKVVGGTLEGVRSAHSGTTGEYGMGLRIERSRDVVVDGVTAKELMVGALAPGAHALVLVGQGKARSVVVTADKPGPVTEYAARELVDHIRMATGVTLEIVRESDSPPLTAGSRVFLGPTREAARAGIDKDGLPADAFVLRTRENDLFVLGREGEGGPLDERTLKGTMFGVYELLERYLGVRWLWPGELGTYVPRTNTLVIRGQLDELSEPAFQFRGARIHHLQQQVDKPNPNLTRLGFSEAVAGKYLDAVKQFQGRYRMGDTRPKPGVGHHFSGWWQRYGKEHPEWFMLNEQGERGPLPGGSKVHVAMCVSNPDLHRFIVEKDWDGGDVLSLGEVDARGFCQCERCLSWDPPKTEEPPGFARADYTPAMVSDRYARFWMTIQEMARKRNPDVRVTTFLYWNYLPAPISDIQLNENIYGEFVPWTGPYVYFPMPEERMQWLREQWLRWWEKGITIAYRPNHLHGGYVMPNFSTRQYGEFFRFGYQHGMIGFDYDSFFGHWATKGPMLYVQMRLFVDPTLEIEQIRREYFAAFGPAARAVERYFDYWEAHSGVRGGNPLDIVSSYPPRVFAAAEPELAEAMQAAQQHSNPEYAQRVAFLQVGLEHARLAARLIRSTDRGRLPDLPPGALGDDGFAGAAERAELPAEVRRFRETQQALADLIALRRKHEHLFFSDLVDAANRERNCIDIDRLLKDMQP